MTEPLPGADPAGENPRVLEEFEALTDEIAKLTGAAREPVDWAKVEALSTDLLLTKAKDLRVAAFLCAARYHSAGLAGLQGGLEDIAELCETFKEALHPNRAKPRAGAFAWLSEYLDPLVPKHEVKPDYLQANLATLDRIGRIFDELETETSGVTSLAAAFRRMQILPSDEEVRERVLAMFPDGLEEVGEALLNRSRELSTNGQTTHSLRLRRMALWLAPPAKANDDRLDTETDPDVLPQLAALASERRWDKLLDESERLFEQYPFALDLTVYSARAAGHALNSESVAAVMGELASLLERAPNLPLQADRDGNPLASADARAWIRAELGGDGPSSTDDAPVVIPGDVRAHLDAGRFAEAMAEASNWLTNTIGRVRFARSVALANAFTQFGANEQSFIVFSGLQNLLRSSSVREWDPKIYAACIEGYLRSKKASHGLGPEDGPLLEELSVLDPTSIMTVMPLSS